MHTPTGQRVAWKRNLQALQLLNSKVPYSLECARREIWCGDWELFGLHAGRLHASDGGVQGVPAARRYNVRRLGGTAARLAQSHGPPDLGPPHKPSNPARTWR